MYDILLFAYIPRCPGTEFTFINEILKTNSCYKQRSDVVLKDSTLYIYECMKQQIAERGHCTTYESNLKYKL